MLYCLYRENLEENRTSGIAWQWSSPGISYIKSRGGNYGTCLLYTSDAADE